MIKNNKGFMLAEVVITSTVIISALVSLYTGVNKLNKIYNERSKYYNIDGIYAIREIIDSLMYNNGLVINSDNSYVYIIKEGNTNNFNSNICNDLINAYNIKNMIIVKKDELDELKKSDINETFKDYLSYMEKYYEDSTDKYSYYIIIEYGKVNEEYGKEDEYYYSNLRLG